MNSDKAAAVRDAVNGCPPVIDPEGEDRVERDKEPFPTHDGRTLTGDRVQTRRSTFRPAYIEQVGERGNGEGATRPVHVVILEPLWSFPDDYLTLSPEIVREIAKHECRIRLYPPAHERGGAIWICDHFGQEITDTAGDRCECGSTYWKLQDGDPHCAKCGRARYDEGHYQPDLTAAMFAGDGGEQ